MLFGDEEKNAFVGLNSFFLAMVKALNSTELRIRESDGLFLVSLVRCSIVFS